MSRPEPRIIDKERRGGGKKGGGGREGFSEKYHASKWGRGRPGARSNVGSNTVRGEVCG